ncbi:glycosyltransferase [Breoghania sp. L-A4]|nr:glycosyltransferase [Breoghania sp. L-A4]
MKPLDDPVPSGDRQVGRLIVQALERGGRAVVQPSRFRSWCRDGGIERQQDLERAALAEADRLVEAFQSGTAPCPDAWLTYHLYHKAPDWVGPAVADALDIPFAVIEASRAMKRKSGPWQHGFAAADAALVRADAVAAMHAADAEGLEPIVPAGALRILPPFIDASPFAQPKQPRPAGAPVRLLTVAMMREGDKMRSHRLLAEALAQVADLDWHLTLVGDGSMRDAVLALFPASRITWLGRLAPEDMPRPYAQADLFVWPAIREAFGLVFLEAQAAGLPVIAGSTGGVPDIMRDGETGWLVPVEDTDAFARALRQAINGADTLEAMGQAARAHVRDRHDIAAAVPQLDAFLQSAAARHAARRNQRIPRT